MSLNSLIHLTCVFLSLPYRERVVKYARIGERDVMGATHIVVSRKGTTAREMKRRKEFVLMERCMEETRDLPLSLWGEQNVAVLDRSV